MEIKIPDFNSYLENIRVNKNNLCIIWIGQAGFLLKTHNDKIIAIDPYLTDSVYKLLKNDYGYGFKRLTSAVFKPGEIIIDYLFSSHEHGDHLDVDAIYEIMDNSRTMLYSNAESKEIAVQAGVPLSRIKLIERDMSIDFEEFKLTVTPADHGEFCDNAMGFIFDFNFVKIYYSGDTRYNHELLQKPIAAKPEIALLPINGAFGNLNAIEAAKLACELNSKICFPHHFWTFPMHKAENGDPIDAIRAFPEYAPNCRLIMLSPGEAFIYEENK